jgi:hypothetical protein
MPPKAFSGVFAHTSVDMSSSPYIYPDRDRIVESLQLCLWFFVCGSNITPMSLYACAPQ